MSISIFHLSLLRCKVFLWAFDNRGARGWPRRPRPPSGTGKKFNSILAVKWGHMPLKYVSLREVLCLVIVYMNVTKYVPRKCEICYQMCSFKLSIHQNSVFGCWKSWRCFPRCKSAGVLGRMKFGRIVLQVNTHRLKTWPRRHRPPSGTGKKFNSVLAVKWGHIQRESRLGREHPSPSMPWASRSWRSGFSAFPLTR